MKKLFLLILLIIIHPSFINSQNVYEHLSADSMANSPNVGRYFVNYLTASSQIDSLSNEADEIHQRGRLMQFWQDRIPVDSDLTNPFLKYSQALKSTGSSSCPLQPGTFNGNWENIGPKYSSIQLQGLVNDLAVDPTNPNNIFLGVQDGGLWQSQNNITSWNCVSDNFLNNGCIGVDAVTINPFNHNDIFAGTDITGHDSRNYVAWFYGQGIWRSTDGGSTWAMETAIPSVADPSMHRTTLMEFANFQIKNSSSGLYTDQLILSADGKTLYAKKIHGTQNTPWDKINFPSWLGPLCSSYRDITFFVDPNGVKRAALSTDQDWSNGPPSPCPPGVVYGRLFLLTFDDLGDIQAWDEIDINNGNLVQYYTGTSYVDATETAYKGNGKLYVMTCSRANQAEHALLEYDAMNNTWTTVLGGWPSPPYSSKYTMEIDVNPNSPDVIYYGNTVPCRIRINPSTSNWEMVQLQPLFSPVCHNDIRKIKIYSSSNTPSNPGSLDEVYWGNDGGISKSIGNTFYNLNSTGFYTTQTYDVDISPTKNRMSIACMHNGISGTVDSNPNDWDWVSFGDGWDAIYDKRSSLAVDPVVMCHGNDEWLRFNHTALGLPSSSAFVRPTSSLKDVKRGYPFQHAFDKSNQTLYMANANMFSSVTAAGPPWFNLTNSGLLSGGTKIGGAGTESDPYDNCRSIAVGKSDPNTLYYGMRRLYFPLDILWSKVNTSSPWFNITPNLIKNGANLTDIVLDSKDDSRVFISLGGVKGTPGVERVLFADNFGQSLNWQDISKGLPTLPVVCLVYQDGSDDILYAGTDAGVYRWDQPNSCWVHFNGSASGGTIPNILINDLEIDYCRGKLIAGSYGRGIWETDLYKPNIIPEVTDIIAPTPSSTTIWNTDKVINGSILIKAGATLQIANGAKIYMPKYGTIYVEPGAKLYIVSGEITNDCGTFWYGIQTFATGYYPQYIDPVTHLDPNHGLVVLEKDGTLSYAEEAFTNSGGAVAGNGGIIQATGGTFYNNHRSAQFLKYENWTNTPPPILQNDLSFFHGCTFTVDDQMRENFGAHITMWGVNGIDLLGNNFTNNQNLNQSHEMAINTLDASYHLDDYDFPNTPSIISGFYQGVHSDAFNLGLTGSPIVIKNNDFNQNEISIQMDNMHYPSIISNNINIGAKQTPLPTSSYQYYSLGSLLRDVSSFIYCGNNHLKAYAPPSGPGVPSCIYQYTAGTEIHNSGDIDQDIINNFYTGLGIGNDCDYTCGSSTITQGINFTCNRNSNNTEYDFLFQANPIIRNIQEFKPNAVGFATGNTFSAIPPGPTNFKQWWQVPPSNGPVKYLYANIPGQVPFAGFHNMSPVVAPTHLCDVDCQSLELQEAMAGELSQGEFQGLKNSFYSKESDYNNCRSLFQQLIDGGDTPGTIEDIENSEPSEAMLIRNEMLLRSPYVSLNVLYSLVSENLLPNAYLLQIIMANPEASRNNEFIKFLQNDAPNPFPEYMISLIQSSWQGNNLRTALESSISDNHRQMTTLQNQIISIYRVSPALYSEDSILLWMQKTPSIRGAYSVIEYLLNKKEYSQSLALLNNLPEQFSFNELDNTEYAAYTSLYNFKKSLLENNIPINELDSTKIAQLKAIADLEDETFPREMARSALCFFYKICYSNGERNLPNQNQNKMAASLAKSVEPSKEVTAYPNPAQDYVAFYYNLNSKNEVSKITIVDLTGKQVYQNSIQGTQGQCIWDTKNISNGQYIYSISTLSNEKFTGKITIQK